jgi:hypothetical protein
MDDFHVSLIEIPPRSSLIARNIFRKSGVAMATPRSIVDQVTVGVSTVRKQASISTR